MVAGVFSLRGSDSMDSQCFHVGLHGLDGGSCDEFRGEWWSGSILVVAIEFVVFQPITPAFGQTARIINVSGPEFAFGKKKECQCQQDF